VIVKSRIGVKDVEKIKELDQIQKNVIKRMIIIKITLKMPLIMFIVLRTVCIKVSLNTFTYFLMFSEHVKTHLIICIRVIVIVVSNSYQFIRTYISL
jgi:hypothetical protein